MRLSMIVSVATAGLLLAACGETVEQRAATGGGTGLVAGAVVGGPVGAAVGAAAGAGAGTALDEGVDKKAGDAVDQVRRPDAPASGSTAAAGRAMTEDQIRAKLRQDGYANVNNLRRDGNVWRATATRNGQAVNVVIDANTGAVRSTVRQS